MNPKLKREVWSTSLTLRISMEMRDTNPKRKRGFLITPSLALRLKVVS
jgi:hypothetical protein